MQVSMVFQPESGSRRRLSRAKGSPTDSATLSDGSSLANRRQQCGQRRWVQLGLSALGCDENLAVPLGVGQVVKGLADFV